MAPPFRFLIPSQKPTLLTTPMGTHARRKNACAIRNFYADSIMDTELPKDFREFLKLLRAHGVEYLLVGGWAVSHHGYPRLTNDLDIWIAISPANAERLVRVLRDFGYDVPELSAALFLQTYQL